MEALNVVCKVIHKNITDEIVIRIRRGPKGYGLLLKLRLLLYSVLKEIFSTRKLLKHIRKHPEVLKRLEFDKCPSKRSLDRWKKSIDYELQQVIALVGNNYLKISKSEWGLLDSTPLRDEDDPDATTGYNSQGPFIGFKLHMSCDEHEVPLRAVVTQAHVHDSQKAHELLVPTPNGGGDAAYDNKDIKRKAIEQGMKLITTHNPRREGKENKKRTPKILRKMRVVIEQCNGFIKSQVMKHSWCLVKGLKAKAIFALTAVLAVQAIALYNLELWGYPSIRIMEVRI